MVIIGNTKIGCNYRGVNMKKLSESKTELVQLRLTKDEKLELVARAKSWGLNVSDYLRLVALEKLPPKL